MNTSSQHPCFLSERVITISEANYQNNDLITEDKYIISLISVKKISEEKSNTNVVIKFC